LSSVTERERVLAEFVVPRETTDKLDIYLAELVRWQRVKNLVAPAELSALWTRHIADSLQLIEHAPEGEWVDLGSGAGLPGAVIAVAAPERAVHLVESNSRKCAFLRHVARRLAPNISVEEGRIEDVLPSIQARVVSARALAPLPQLLAWTQCLLRRGAVALFPKGRGYAAELTEARKSWRFTADLIPSRTDSAARIIRVRSLDGTSSP
jgi:16S rRNA (guanine527-N7)-methyltransferase